MPSTVLRFHGRSVRSYGPDHPIARAIADQREFRAGAMRGERGGPWSMGRLPEPWYSQLNKVDQAGEVTFTVYSYATPVAWWSAGELVVPDVTYSVTTSRHQGYARAASWGR